MPTIMKEGCAVGTIIEKGCAVPPVPAATSRLGTPMRPRVRIAKQVQRGITLGQSSLENSKLNPSVLHSMPSHPLVTQV